MMAEGETLDPAALDNLLASVGGDREFLGELIDTFFEDAPGQLAQMRQALAGGDAELLRRAAHTLKSNSANFGALGLADTCRQLEELGKAGALAEAAALAEQAETQYAQAQAALQAVRAAG